MIGGFFPVTRCRCLWWAAWMRARMPRRAREGVVEARKEPGDPEVLENSNEPSSGVSGPFTAIWLLGRIRPQQQWVGGFSSGTVPSIPHLGGFCDPPKREFAADSLPDIPVALLRILRILPAQFHAPPSPFRGRGLMPTRNLLIPRPRKRESERPQKNDDKVNCQDRKSTPQNGLETASRSPIVLPYGRRHLLGLPNPLQTPCDAPSIWASAPCR